VNAPYKPQHIKPKGKTKPHSILLEVFSNGRICVTDFGRSNFNGCVQSVEIHPKNLWTCMKPSVSQFKNYGSLYFKHVPEQTRKKLDDGSQVMILIC
jgi:hypothetical protein